MGGDLCAAGGLCEFGKDAQFGLGRGAAKAGRIDSGGELSLGVRDLGAHVGADVRVGVEDRLGGSEAGAGAGAVTLGERQSSVRQQQPGEGQRSRPSALEREADLQLLAGLLELAGEP